MLIVEIRGEQVWRRIDHSTVNDPLPTQVGEQSAHEAPPANCVELLTDWSTRYNRAVESGNQSDIHLLGSDIYKWLDQGGALVPWASGPEREFEIRTESAHSNALTDALLATPWEIICWEGEFLAKQTPLFSVARQCGVPMIPTAPRHSDLSLMFMAAAPEGQNELDYEAEEVAIIDVTASKLGGAPLAHVQVEESGALELLAERLRLDGPFEVLHLSCHGDIVQSEDAQNSAPLPILLFETSTGSTHPVRPDELLGALERHMPQLVFVSACRTAQRGTGRVAPGIFSEGRGVILTPNANNLTEQEMRREGNSAKISSPPDLADPFVRQLSVQAPNVLGWDGSVYDLDAALFAQELYSKLSRGETVPRAAALARRALFDVQNVNPQTGRHWHLSRVYLGPGGGGVLCDPTLQHARPAKPDPEVPFLDKRNRRVPVATRAEFVGRRRQIQTVIRSYRKGRKGVLIHGMGNLGKSSLAARVAARMPQHRIAVVFGECHALAVINALTRSLEEITDGMPLADAQSLQAEIETLTTQVTENDAALESALRRLLRGIFNTYPVLLILDDLEQSLLAPSADNMQVQPKPEYNATLKAVFSAFAAVTTTSRCLLTSRYDFALNDGAGGDLTAEVERVPLAPMRKLERQKQWQARARSEEQGTTVASVSRDLIETVLLAAAGNPGLQEVLTQPLLRGETDTAQTAIAAINEFRATGIPLPASIDIGDFFRRMAFETYSSALSATQKAGLTATTFFAEEIPIPCTALDAILQAYGIDEPQRTLDRLLALGLLDDWGNLQAGRGTPVLSHYSTNPLARPLADKLSESDRQTLASAAVSSLATAWQDEDGDFPYDKRSIEITRLALQANRCEPTILDAAAKAAVIYHYDLSDNAQLAVTVARTVLTALEATKHPPSPVFLRKTIAAAERIGDVELQDALLEQVLGRDDIDNLQRALLLGQKGDRLVQMGELDAALKIRQEETLPVYEALGDKRSVAVTKGQIADILVSRGELDAALKIRQEDELPVYEALGDKRSVALTKGQIADILVSRGELDAALKIRQEDELPV
ncbi:MAG: AAA family ATPase, partial [Planctomycetaceae bacterium]|nr:AAA family ATPase [Planctomycetaceae bacterium]